MARLRQRAQRQAQAAGRPSRIAARSSRRATRTTARQSRRSVRSETNAIQQSIGGAMKDFRQTPGLKGRDLRIGLETLARDKVYAQEGQASQVGEINKQQATGLASINSTAAQDAAQQHADMLAALATMQANRQSNRQAVKASQYTQSQENLRALMVHPPSTGKGGSSSSTGSLTQNEQHAIHKGKSDAMALIHQALAAAHASGAVPQTADQWQLFGAAALKAAPGTVHPSDIEWAINRVQTTADPFSQVQGGIKAVANALGGKSGGAGPPRAPTMLPPYLRGLTLPH
jgi:hypothetical protein